MVSVTSYALRMRKDGSTFVVLELTGGLEIIQSSNTGKHYATVRKCTIPSTFSEEIAKTMVGQSLPGKIVKEEVDPYEYKNQRTGEIMLLNHSYAFQAEGASTTIGQTKVMEMELA
jgi:hypothetical protein